MFISLWQSTVYWVQKCSIVATSNCPVFFCLNYFPCIPFVFPYTSPWHLSYHVFIKSIFFSANLPLESLLLLLELGLVTFWVPNCCQAVGFLYPSLGSSHHFLSPMPSTFYFVPLFCLSMFSSRSAGKAARQFWHIKYLLCWFQVGFRILVWKK